MFTVLLVVVGVLAALVFATFLLVYRIRPAFFRLDARLTKWLSLGVEMRKSEPFPSERPERGKAADPADKSHL